MVVSRFQGQIRCAYCHEINIVTDWPRKGDQVAFYCQTKDRTKEAPGRYRVTCHCPYCGEDWFVVWDDDPR